VERPRTWEQDRPAGFDVAGGSKPVDRERKVTMDRIQSFRSVVWLGSLLTCAAAYGQPARSVIPSGTVVKVALQEPLRSKDARVGDRIRVQVAGDDRSGMPASALLVGRVTQVQRATRSQPGIVDIDFRAAELRSRWIPISGAPYTLHEKDVQETASGRLVAKGRRNDRMKFIGYGALGGVLLGRLLGTSTLKGVLLGGAAGYLYGQSRRDRSEYRDVDMKKGAEFGVRLNRSVALRDSDFAGLPISPPGRQAAVATVAGRAPAFRQ
jgi:hypothetical protein